MDGSLGWRVSVYTDCCCYHLLYCIYDISQSLMIQLAAAAAAAGGAGAVWWV